MFQHLQKAAKGKSLSNHVKYETVWSCENDANKQKWIKYMHQNESQTCIFDDIESLHHMVCKCVVHPDVPVCPVPEPRGERLAVAGFSCKDLSSLNKRARRAGTSALANGTGSSAKTLRGLLLYLETSNMYVWVGENLDDLDKVFSVNRQFMLQELGNIGWVADTVSLDSSQLGAPTARKRAYIIAINCYKCNLSPEDSRKLLTSIVTCIQKLVVPMLPLTDFLLEDNDPYMQTFFESLGNRGGHAEPGWEKTFYAALSKAGMSWSECIVPDKTMKSKWYKTLKPREKMVLAYELKRHPQATCIDVGQSAGWSQVSETEVLPTMIPRGWFWIRLEGREERLLTGKEMLMLHGFPKSSLANAGSFSDGLFRDLAGNSFHAFAFMATLIGLITYWPFCGIPDEPDVSDDAPAIDDVLGDILDSL